MALQQTAPIFRLPGEIRNQIYALSCEGSKLDIDQQYRNHRTPAPGLVLACKQTYAESVRMYYTNLSIVTKDHWILTMWLVYLGYLQDSHPYKLIKKIYLDCRNRGEHDLPLQLGQRFALSHHSQLSLDRVHQELAKVRQPLAEGVDLKVRVVTPNQELVWTKTPFALGEAVEDAWNGMWNTQGTAIGIDIGGVGAIRSERIVLVKVVRRVMKGEPSGK